MALNLSTLTNPATSGGILAEALTTADFLDPVPILKNLSRGSNKGGDAKQTTALNQPKALPLIKNPSGNLGGYLYIPDVAGNYATGPSVTIGANETWEAEVDMVITQNVNYIAPFGGGAWNTGFGLFIQTNGDITVWSKSVNIPWTDPEITLGTPFNLKYGYDGSSIYFDVDGVRKQTLAVTSASQSASITHPLQLNQQALTPLGNYAIQKAKLTVNSSVVFDCDFNGSTSIRHGDTKFQASVGGPVTLTKVGNDPVTVVKKGVLRFDGANDFIGGLFNQTVTGGYMFAAFSVLGNGGELYGRLLGMNATGGVDSIGTGGLMLFQGPTGNVTFSYRGTNGSSHVGGFDDARGDVLFEQSFESGSQISKINNADENNGTDAFSGSISSQEFKIAAATSGNNNASIDLEYLAVFPATITDAEADSVRNYINKRNNVFDLKDGFGYYFYDAQKAPVGAITTGSASWNGRIVGSDNGDTDKFATQGTTNEEPVGDGYVVTFADNADHLEITQVTQAGWQVVGTSLGTFAYRVDNDAVTELNLLGNLGDATYRRAGDLYGIILLPESATGADIEAARKLLIDRGAADGVSGSSVQNLWRGRDDIVNFNNVNFTNVNNFLRAFRDASSLSDFPAIDASNGTNFTGAWQGTTALTSFPAGAKLGTSANNVNFESAFRSSGLTSFPALDLSKGDNFYFAWIYCPLSDFSADAKLGTNANLGRAFESTLLTSFQTPINTAKSLYRTWNTCNRLVDFSADVFLNWNPSIINSSVFHETWAGCSALSAISVQNILTSIDASNQHGTDDGTSTGNPLGDSGIDIDYNVATGSLSAATNSAVTSLKSKGWSIVVNGVTL